MQPSPLPTVSNSTLSGVISLSQYNTFNIGGANGNHTINLSGMTFSGFSGSPAPFIIGAGGTLNNSGSTATSINGSSNFTMAGGSVTNTGGGPFSIGDVISGYGTISGPIAINDGATASGGTASQAQTLILDGTHGAITVGATSFQASQYNTLDMKGTFNYPSTGGFLNPGGGTVQLDSATLNKLATPCIQARARLSSTAASTQSIAR